MKIIQTLAVVEGPSLHKDWKDPNTGQDMPHAPVVDTADGLAAPLSWSTILHSLNAISLFWKSDHLCYSA